MNYGSGIVKIELIQNREKLASYEDAWRRLADGFPFRQPEWLLSWWKHFASPEDRLFVVATIDESDRVRSLAPWYCHLPTGEIRFLGDGTVCTDHPTILTDIGFHDENPIEATARFLIDAARDRDGWRQLKFEAVNPLDRNMQTLHQALLREGALPYEGKSANTWEVDLSGGWQVFLSGVSKNARKTFRRRSEELEKVEVRWVSNTEELNLYLPVLIDLHQRRRQSLGDAGCFADERFKAFLVEVAEKFLDLGALQAFSLWMDGKPISADIGFRSKDRWMCYQSGIEPDAIEHQPGKLANVLMLRDAEKFGIRVVDFLRGDEPYKQLLQANPTPVRDIFFAPRNWNGRFRHWFWQGRDQAKRVAKRFRKTAT